MRSKPYNRIVFLVTALVIFGVRISPCQPVDSNADVYCFRDSRYFGLNPALLGLKISSGMSLVLPAVQVSFGNNTYSPGFFGDTFAEGEWLSERDKKDILEQIKSDNVDIFGRGNAHLFGMNIGNYGFSLLDFNSQASVSIPQDIFKLVIRGWEDGIMYNFDDVEWETYNYWTTSFLMSKSLFPPRWFDEFSVGATFKYIRGMDYWGLGQTDANFQVIDTTINTEGIFEYLSSSAGDGMGLDLGVAGWFRPIDAYVGLILGNLVGSIKWSSVKVEEVRFERHKGVELDSISKADYWERFFNKTDSTYWAGSFYSPLPLYLLLAAYKPAVYMDGQGDLFASIYQALNKTPGYSTVPKLRVGSELKRFTWLRLQAEVALGGVEGFELGAGFGVSYKNYRSNLYGAWQRGVLGGAKGFSFMFRNSYYLPQRGAVRKIPAPEPVKPKPPEPEPVKSELPEPEPPQPTTLEPDSLEAEKVMEPPKEKKVIPIVDQPAVPEPPKGMSALTMAALGIEGMDPGESLYRKEFYPFETDPVFFTQIDNEKYDQFLKDAAVIDGVILLAKRIISVVEARDKNVMKTYDLRKKKPYINKKSPFYTFCVETLSPSLQRTKELISTGSDLSRSIRNDFKGKEAMKLPKVIRAVNGSVKRMKQAQQELPELIEKLCGK